MCRGLDEQVELFRGRPLEGAYPYLWLDAKHVKVRDHGRVVSKALVVAYAVHETGLREVIGLDIGEVESGSFWVEFLRSLKKRGLAGVRLAISDQHEGLKQRSLACWPARGSAAPCTSSETCSRTAAATSAAWSPPPSGRSSTPRIETTPANASGTSSSASRPSLRKCAGSSRTPRRTSSPSTTCHQSTGPSSAVHQPLGAGQQRDRPPLRCRRHLPQRRRRDPPRRRAALRAER